MDRTPRIQVTPRLPSRLPSPKPPATENSTSIESTARKSRISGSASISHTSSGHNHSNNPSSPSLLRGFSSRSGEQPIFTSINDEKPSASDILAKIRAQYDEVDTSYFHGMRDLDAACIMVEQMHPDEVQQVCLQLLSIVHLSKLQSHEESREESRNMSPSPLPEGSNSSPLPVTPPAEAGPLQAQITFSFNQTHSSAGTSAIEHSRSDLGGFASVLDAGGGKNKAIFLHPTFDLPGHMAMSRTASMASLGNISLASIASRAPVRSTNQLTKTEDEESGHKKFNQYVILSELGRGTQAKVKLAYDTATKELRAIRIIKRPSKIAVGPARNKLMANRFGRIEKEIAVMKRLRHKNLVRLFEVIDDPSTQKLYLVLQYIKYGNLAVSTDGMFIKPVDPHLLLGYARQLCAGLTYLHKRNIAHRDVKPDNILLGDSQDVYLADFGVADFLAQDEMDDLNTAQHESIASLPSATLEASPRTRRDSWSKTYAPSSSSCVPFAPEQPRTNSFVVSSSRAGRLTQGPAHNSFASSGGFGKSPQPAAGGAVGTPAFFAPEAINLPPTARLRKSLFEQDMNTSPSVSGTPMLAPSADPAALDGCSLDVWALGVTLFMMLCGRLPWLTMNNTATDEKDRYWFNTQEYFRMVQFDEPMFPPHQGLIADREVTLRLFGFEEREEPLPEPWVDLLKSMMVKDPKRRPAMADIRRQVKDVSRLLTPPPQITGEDDEFNTHDASVVTRAPESSERRTPRKLSRMVADGALARVPSFNVPDSELEDAITHLVDFSEISDIPASPSMVGSPLQSRTEASLMGSPTAPLMGRNNTITPS